MAFGADLALLSHPLMPDDAPCGIRSLAISKPMSIENRTIQTKDEFLAFLAEFRADLEASPHQWENATLPEFLRALSDWIEDSDGYYKNIGDQLPPQSIWRYVADALSGARVYE